MSGTTETLGQPPDLLSAAPDKPFADHRSGIHAIRMGPVSVRYTPRAVLVAVVLMVAVGAAAVAHVSIGGTAIPLTDVWGALTGLPVDPTIELAVTQFRAPRLAAAALVGGCLAASGAITQTVARNPLASPDVLGVTAGASAGAVAVLILADGGAAGVSGLAAAVGLPAAAFGGGLAAGTTVYALAYRRGIDSVRLILVGLGISGLGTSLTTWMLTLGDVTSAAQALTWMTGSLNGKDWTTVLPMSGVAAVLLAAAVAAGRWLLTSAFDDDTATGLGLRLSVVRVTTLGLAVLLATVATVIAGPLAFVALASPQIARLLTRAPTPPIAVSVLVGALFVLVSDIIAGTLLPIALPVGVATAVLGAPYLIHLVLRVQRRP